MKFVKLIQEYFDSEMVEEVTYNQWESTDRGNIITRISSIEDFIEDFVNLMEDLITHHYIYKEQSAFLNERLNALQDGEVVIVVANTRTKRWLQMYGTTKKDFGIPAQWHFFATSHGKSACDGIGGTLKRLATYYSKQHIQPGTLITTPLLFFEFAQKQVKGICSLWVSTEEVAEVETKLKVRFNSAYKIDGIKSCHSITPCENENFVFIRKYSEALESTKRKISTAEDHTLKLEEVRGYAIYWNHEEPKWNLCYVDSTNEETGEINIEELTNRKGKKFEYEFVEGAAKDILCDDILLLVNPQIMSRGKVIKVLASDSNTADVLLQQAPNSQ
ncbi:Protein FAM153B [Frankliniella fusca]|uniref:Protein FAM153B n=1 Tax=Frankliniella fusca TaxID=407009 RepID=A0AAE1I2L7_9NEOP|nr:Protein FAM153B [Frankliniella fusca]